LGKQARPESIILIPVLEAAPLVHRYRLQYDPSAPAHVPEHLTLLYPFLSPDTLDAAVLSTLRATLSTIAPFSFSLRHTAWFEQGVLYLAPDPAAPFSALTWRLSRLFNILPFEGRFPEPIPHLTVAHDGPKDALMEIATTIAAQLPIDAVAREAWLMIGHNETGWVRHERFPFERT
jgi:hypothetical protein